MRVLHIATVGEDITPILVGIRELPVTKLILLYTQDAQPQVRDLNANSPTSWCRWRRML